MKPLNASTQLNSTPTRSDAGATATTSARSGLRRHEKIGDDEIFVGNTTDGPAQIAWLLAKGMKTVRLGQQAYCWEGKQLPEIHKPVIIGRVEELVYDDIIMRQTFGEHWKRR